MKPHMDKNVKILLVAVVLAVVTPLAALWSTFSYWPPSPFPGERLPPPEHSIRGDIELFYTIKTVFSTVNVVLLVALLTTYATIYRKTRSEFTIGLMIFSVIFLMDALTSSPLVMGPFGFRAFGLGPFAMLPDLFKCTALAVLLYLSIKY